MKACSLTATDEDGDENTLSFFLTISANLMPSFGDASVDALAYTRKQEIASLTLPQVTGGADPRSARELDLCGQVRLALGQERYDPRCDLNGDGEIGFDDFLIFAADFGSTG